MAGQMEQLRRPDKGKQKYGKRKGGNTFLKHGGHCGIVAEEGIMQGWFYEEGILY